MADNPRRNDPEFIYLREVVQRFIDLNSSRGLEIGPFDRPFFTKTETDVVFLDYRQTDEARIYAEVAPGHSPEFVVDIDYVVPAWGDWSAVPGDAFDWVLSSHALEHCPNLIGFLHTVASKLKAGGLLVSVLPDKRRTFDARRPLSTMGLFIEDHMLDRKVPRAQAVFDLTYYSKMFSAEEMREISFDMASNNRNFAVAYREATRARDGYVDTHNYVFTSSSFESIITELCDMKMIPFQQLAHILTRDEDMSFLSILQKAA